MGTAYTVALTIDSMPHTQDHTRVSDMGMAALSLLTSARGAIAEAVCMGGPTLPHRVTLRSGQ